MTSAIGHGARGRQCAACGWLILAVLLTGDAANAQPSTRSTTTTTTTVTTSTHKSAPPRREKIATEPGYTLAFVGADVRRVIDAVLGDMLGADYDIDPGVTGTITLRTARPVRSGELLPLLENALASVDAAIVARGGGYHVVSRATARAQAPLATSGSSDAGKSPTGFVTEVVPLANASPREIARLLQQFLGKEVVAATDPTSNQVLITGSAAERAAARELIARFDVDAMAGRIFETYKLDNVDPDTLIAELQRIFAPPLDIIGTRVRLVPLPRLRSVLAIAANRSDLARIEPWLRRLDAGTGGKPKLYSYAVQNGRARDLAVSLQLVLGATVQQQGQLTVGPVAASAAAPIQTLSGNAFGAAPTGADAQLEPSQAIGPQTPLPGASVEPVAASTPGGPRIVPNEENNSLLIYATGEQYEFIREALDKLDQPVAQVLIEATLAEVTLTKDFSLGVDWSFLTGNSSFDLRNQPTAAPAAIFPGFSYAYIGRSAQVVLNTLQSRTNVKVLSAPKLMVLNNQTATLQVGDQVPIVTQQAQSVSAAGAPVVNSVELRDTGVILKVTPRVNDSGTIILDIAQEVSDVVQTTTSGINSPTIQQRRLASTVATRSGQMVALGGLIRDSLTKRRSGIPLLSQIPILGAAFGRQTEIGTRTELVILLTPTVMRTADETRAVVDDLLQGLDATRPIVERARTSKAVAPPPPRR